MSPCSGAWQRALLARDHLICYAMKANSSLAVLQTFVGPPFETALPAKFADTIREAIGRDPERPAAYARLEDLPQRFDVLPADVAAVKAYIAAHDEA